MTQIDDSRVEALAAVLSIMSDVDAAFADIINGDDMDRITAETITVRHLSAIHKRARRAAAELRKLGDNPGDG